MVKFEQTRTGDNGAKVYDLAMPQNAESYGSKVVDPNGKEHDQLVHSKVRVWRADDPGSPCDIIIVSGNGGHDDSLHIPAGAIEYPVPMAGLVSVEPVDPNISLCVYGEVVPNIWGG